MSLQNVLFPNHARQFLKFKTQHVFCCCCCCFFFLFCFCFACTATTQTHKSPKGTAAKVSTQQDDKCVFIPFEPNSIPQLLKCCSDGHSFPVRVRIYKGPQVLFTWPQFASQGKNLQRTSCRSDGHSLPVTVRIYKGPRVFQMATVCQSR